LKIPLFFHLPPGEGRDRVVKVIKFIKFVKKEKAGPERLSPPWIRRGQGVVGLSVCKVHQDLQVRKSRPGAAFPSLDKEGAGGGWTLPVYKERR